ncbi:hypothetical protein RJ640_007565 [Escallonia rubra]|uniref:Protein DETOXIFICATION n=1 Tax=Escallonia rubra TaxID=112253 RepID=A0AA88SI42_9ASTE|nr:hypothetical protein RJ640_007565 [Escallonia rubra]
MEDGLLLQGKREEKGVTGRVLGEEVKRLVCIAGPMVAVTLSQYLLQVISVMMVGHLGELSLSSTAIGMSLCNVTGFSVIMGMASALETLCGQAYGAHQYKKLGTQTYTATLSIYIVSIPIAIMWTYMGKILIHIGQDQVISREAGKFTRSLVPALFAYATLQPLVRFFQMQSMVLPMLISSCASVCIHVPLCWVLVFKSGLGNLGVALAVAVSMWLNVIFLVSYMKFSTSCEKTRVPISMEILHGIGEFFRFAIPAAVMLCLEWWSFELLILLSGLLPNPKLETSVLSVWYPSLDEEQLGPELTTLNTILTLQAIPYGLGAGARCVTKSYHLILSMTVLYLFVFSINCSDLRVAKLQNILSYGVRRLSNVEIKFNFFSTRVSNELGAGNPQGARVAVYAVMLLAVTETTIVSTSLFASRRVFGFIFSNEKEVVDYVTTMAPLLCLSVIADTLNAALTGIARGCGWQHIGAYVNLAAFYLCGIPVAATLGFWVQLRGMGLWIGILAGASTEIVLLSLVTCCTSWEKQAIKARERLFKGKSSSDNVALMI